MHEQLLPFDEAEESRIQRAFLAFLAFHATHPDVYRLLVRFAREARRAGHQRYGLKALVERVRWHYHVERGEGEWKINNSFTSRYARLLMEREPDLSGFFETRELKERGARLAA